MRKYYHPEGIIKDGKIVCKICGAELDTHLMGDTPCAIPAASRLQIDGLNFEISVWDCKASLDIFSERGNGREYYEYLTSEKEKKVISEMIENSIYESGGSLNQSGIYSVSSDMELFLENLIKTKAIKFVKKENISNKGVNHEEK